MAHTQECLCARCVPLCAPESRPARCACADAGGGLTCSLEEQLLCGWRDVEPGDLVLDDGTEDSFIVAAVL